MATNIGKIYLNLIKKHFPRGHKFHKIFNKNTMKVSYSCMPNIKSSIDAHNSKILCRNQNEVREKDCNCTNKANCPLSNDCLDSCLVYEGTITSDIQNQIPMKYIGLCEPTFKRRHAVHKTSFNRESYRTSTTLSAECWKIKDLGGSPSFTWRKIGNAPSYSAETKKCLLCLREKFEIANYPGKDLLNKRTEIIAKCRHRRKHQLLHYKNEPGD